MEHPVAQFLSQLGDDVSAPEVLLEADGNLSFDWDRGRRRVVSASLSRTGRVAWAALLGDQSTHGTFTLPAWSEAFSRAVMSAMTVD